MKSTLGTHDVRLLPLGITAWLSAWVGVGIDRFSLAVAIVALCSAAIAVVVTCVTSRWRLVMTHGAFCFGVIAVVMGICIPSGLGSRVPDALRDHFKDDRQIEAEIVVTSDLALRDGAFESSHAFRFRGDITSVVLGEERVAAATPVVILGNGEHSAPAGLGIGDHVRVHGGLISTNDGDRTAFLLTTTSPVELTAHGSGVIRWARDLRAGFRSVTDALPGDGGKLLPGLAIGDTSAVTHDLDTSMVASSLSHLTAVSGANCAIISAGIMGLMSLLGFPRWARIVGAILALILFVVLVTPQASVLRAAVMAAIVLVALYRGRRAGGVSALCLAVTLLLLYDPWLARDYGFALSVCATGGLLFLTRPLSDRFERRMPRWLALAIAVPIAAQLACQPVLVLLNPTISLFSVPANVLAAPAAPVATVLGLISVLCAPVVPLIALVVAWVAWVPASWIGGVARFIADLPGSSLPWLDGFLGALCAAALIALGFVLLRSDLSRRWQGGIAVGLAGALTVYVGTLAGGAATTVLRRPQNWDIAACDVGQGDALLVRSRSSYALIDAGPDPEMLRRCLGVLGIAHLDLVVLTHFDRDHVGGIEAVVGRARRALVGPATERSDKRVLEKLENSGTSVSAAVAGDHGTLGDTTWTVLWPSPGDVTAGAHGNDASVVIRIDSPRLSGLFLGDLGESAQNRLLATGVVSMSDVVKVAHHGSADQSSRLYSIVAARVAVYSVGATNRYGHPTNRALEISHKTPSTVLRTDERGTVTIARDASNEFSVWSERSSERIG